MENYREELDISEEELQHYGVSVLEGAPGVGSGRYPLGSGYAAYQRQRNFRTTVAELKRNGMTDIQIAKHLGLKNTSELRAKVSRNKEEIHAYEVALAKKLKAKGMSNTAIAERMFKDAGKESTVRNLVKEGNAVHDKIFEATANALKDELEVHPYLDVGVGTELYFPGVSQTRLKNVVTELEKEGYKLHSQIGVYQYGANNGQKTTIKVLTKDDVTDRDIYNHLEEIKPAGVYSEDGGETFRKFEPPASIDSSRVYIKYAEEGGKNKDGVIELRRGVEDLSLGKANYAQVRIAVDDKYYLKGMAMYGNDIPDGYDVVFNTNKHEGTSMPDVLKKMQFNKDGTLNVENPFKASIKTEDQLTLANESEGFLRRQRHYIGEDGKEHLSAINIVNEEGNWNEWSRDISAQMLSKQPPALAKKQLDLTYQLKKEQFDEICSLTNPTVKKKLLNSFADKCDSDAVHLKAYGFPGQIAKVLLPVDDLPDNQCYCPEFDTGTPVVLIRYPHAGIFEIPQLTVNNNHKNAKSILGAATDAIGINSRVAEHLSGADFDGDTVWVIPNKDGAIKWKEYEKDLKTFDPKEAYPGYPGMKNIGKQKGREMGKVTNLITDMTIADAPMKDIVKAVKHSMVVIDAEKHNLDWKRSEIENDIQELRDRYQPHDDGKGGGSATLISRAKSEVRVLDRAVKGIDDDGNIVYRETGKLAKQGKYDKNGKWIRPEAYIKKADIESGRVEYEDLNGKSHTGKIKDINRKDGSFKYVGDDGTTRKGQFKMNESTKMAEASDATTLISRHNKPIERIYASFANGMKNLARSARKEAAATPSMKRNAEAREVYAAEVESLTAKLRRALKNKPLERQAQILSNAYVRQFTYDNPEVKDDKDAMKKLKGRTLTRMREKVGANKWKVSFTDKEWKAVQSGAVSDSFFRQLLDNADADHVKQLAMPRESRTISGAKQSRVRQLLNNGYNQNQVANMLDVPINQVKQVAMDMR